MKKKQGSPARRCNHLPPSNRGIPYSGASFLRMRTAFHVLQSAVSEQLLALLKPTFTGE